MRQHSLLVVIIITVFSLLQFGCCSSKEPRNIFYAKQEIIQYYNSGDYDSDIVKVTTKAKRYLAQKIKENNTLVKKQKLAVTLDIDDTLLSNYKNLQKIDFSANQENLTKNSIIKGNLPAITASLDFYNFAKKHDVAVFLICARKEHLAEITIKNLHNAGYHDWNGLYLRPASYKQKSFVDFKTNARKILINKGYDVIINMGDQYSDLSGGHADKTFKLPNPLYYSS